MIARTKLMLLLIPCATLVCAQPRQDDGKSAKAALSARRSKYREQGAQALSKERARSQRTRCANVDRGGNTGLAACLLREQTLTEQDYTAYIQSLGALLRLQDAEGPKSAESKLRFDSAEAEWQSYRTKGCKSVAAQWQGGDQSQVAYPDCLIRVTRDHMNELSQLYADLWR